MTFVAKTICDYFMRTVTQEQTSCPDDMQTKVTIGLFLGALAIATPLAYRFGSRQIKASVLNSATNQDNNRVFTAFFGDGFSERKNVEAATQERKTTLHLACQGRDLSGFDPDDHQYLLDKLNTDEIFAALKNIGEAIDERDSDGRTALHLLCMRSGGKGRDPFELEVERAISGILQKGASATLEDNFGNQPIHYVATRSFELHANPLACLLSFIKNRKRELLSEPTSLENKNIQNIYELGEQLQGEETLENAVENSVKSVVNARNKMGQTPLHLALSIPFFDESNVDTLIRFKADVNIQDNAGDSPLHILIRRADKGKFVTFEVKLATFDKMCQANGQMLNPLLYNADGLTPLHLDLLFRKGLYFLTPDNVNIPIQEKREGHVNTLSHFRNLQVGSTLGHIAVATRQVGCIKDLRDKGADFSLKDAQGRTPLMIAFLTDEIDSLWQLLFRPNSQNRLQVLDGFIDNQKFDQKKVNQEKEKLVAMLPQLNKESQKKIANKAFQLLFEAGKLLAEHPHLMADKESQAVANLQAQLYTWFALSDIYPKMWMLAPVVDIRAEVFL